jgi:hypothetical protein
MRMVAGSKARTGWQVLPLTRLCVVCRRNSNLGVSYCCCCCCCCCHSFLFTSIQLLPLLHSAETHTHMSF